MFIVHSGRSGFEAKHEFTDLAAAEAFFADEVANIGGPAELIELDEEGNLVRIIRQVKK